MEIAAQAWRNGSQRLFTLPPAAVHLLFHGVALWPHLVWMMRRGVDGSDAPLGLAAMAAMFGLVLRDASRIRRHPHALWLHASWVLLAVACIARFHVPPLLAAAPAMLSLACALLAWLPVKRPPIALFGLALLTLPLIASLQFYAGYPLRVVTAEASAQLLSLLSLEIERSGASLRIGDRLVLVDAPCSGVQMAWMAYFAAFALALASRLENRFLLSLLPLIGALVLIGNVIRNSILVALESRPGGLSSLMHECIGLMVLAAVILTVFAMLRPGPPCA